MILFPLVKNCAVQRLAYAAWNDRLITELKAIARQDSYPS